MRNFDAMKKGVPLLAIMMAIAGTDPGVKAATVETGDDPYLWLEDVSGEKALKWVRQQNATSQKELESLPDFEPNRKRILAILDSKERSRT